MFFEVKKNFKQTNQNSFLFGWYARSLSAGQFPEVPVPVVLQQRCEEAHQAFEEAGVPRTTVPFLKGQLTALMEVV